MDENISLFSEDGGDKLTADDQAIFDTWREEPEKEPDGEEAPETKDSWDKETADLQEKAAPESKADQSFKLKVLGQEIEASRDEVIALAQKGKDYDRIRGKLSELTAREAKSGEYRAFIQELAAPQGITVEEFMDRAKADILSRNRGVDKRTALAQIKLDRREKALKERETDFTAKNDLQKAAERRRSEIREFLSEYENIDPKTIPKEVWTSVARGKTLLSAYQSYENKSLKSKLEAEKKSFENKGKSPGSRATFGKAFTRDEIESDWYSEE